MTSISLSTNVATGTNTFTTLAPMTITCGGVNITAGAANGTTGVTLNLSAGWTFTGGAAPTIGYAWGGGPTGDAVGTIVSATSITAAILASCDPGDVMTFTGVQVKPTTGATANGTIIADIATANVTTAQLTAAGPAQSNNVVTPISLTTNAATGSSTFTTLPPMTMTCSVVDITAGAANGVFGVTLNLSAGWTFAGGAAPTISYAWGGGPTGDAVGTIASPTSITAAILASCDPGDVMTFTGVQVRPTTGTTGNGTITADIATADVTMARMTALAIPPVGEPEGPPPAEEVEVVVRVVPPPSVVPAVVPPVVPVVVPVIVPTPVLVAVPAACPPGSVVAPPVVIPRGVGQVVVPPIVVPAGGAVVCVPIVAAGAVVPKVVVQVVPLPATTGNAGLASSRESAQTEVWLLGLATVGLVLAGRKLVSRRSAG